MKRKIRVTLLALVCIVLLTGCKCKHEWVAADCVTPKTCSKCQETEGAPLGHDWLAATCEEAKTCKVCGVVEGMAAGHGWVEASCIAPKHCENCDLTEGELLPHAWLNATTEAPKTCSVCGTTEGERIITDERFKTEKCSAVFGDWKCELTESGEMMELEEYVEEVPVVAVLTFTEDGRITVDMAFRDAKQFTQDLHAGTVEAIYRQFDGMDMTREEADQTFLDAYGMSIEEYCTAMWAVVDWDTLLDLYETEAVYYIDEDQIYVANDWEDAFSAVAYSISGNTMTLTGSILESDTVLELTKVQ